MPVPLLLLLRPIVVSPNFLHKFPGADDPGRGGQPGLARQRDLRGAAGARQRLLLPGSLQEYLVRREGGYRETRRDGACATGKQRVSSSLDLPFFPLLDSVHVFVCDARSVWQEGRDFMKEKNTPKKIWKPAFICCGTSCFFLHTISRTKPRQDIIFGISTEEVRLPRTATTNDAEQGSGKIKKPRRTTKVAPAWGAP